MGEFFSRLPDHLDKAKIAEGVREIIKSFMSERDLSYRKVANHVDLVLNKRISDGAIRLFLTDEGHGRVNASNATLPMLYDFILSYYHRLPGSTKARFHELVEELGLQKQPKISDVRVAIGTHFWVNATKVEIARLADKLRGSYVILRRSTVNSQYIKSTLHVSSQREDGHNYIRCTHIHRDRSKMKRQSEGFAFPVVRNIYLAMRVEGYEGLETIVVRDPVQLNPEFFMGFMFGLNGDRNIYNSSLLMERLRKETAPIWDQIPSRFDRGCAALEGLGPDFLYRLDQVLSESRSRLLPRFNDSEG